MRTPLRISYNIKDVFVNFKDNTIDKETIEGIAVESFIEKYNLSTEWINEGWQWGGTDENGTFIGIIGRVRLIYVIVQLPNNMFEGSLWRSRPGNHEYLVHTGAPGSGGLFSVWTWRGWLEVGLKVSRQTFPSNEYYPNI